MSDRTFRLILDGKKGGLVKGSSPSSAAKKASKKLSAETGKTSFKFELQETTKDSKKKVYGPYKIKVKMEGGGLPIPNKNADKKIKVNNPFSILINQGNDEYQALLKIKEIAKNWNNVGKILEKANDYSNKKLKQFRNKLENINTNIFGHDENLVKLFEYYKKHKAELEN
jgi:hypothetical protein